MSNRIYIMVEPNRSCGFGRLHYSIPDEGSEPPKLMQSLFPGFILVREALYADGTNEWAYSIQSVETIAPLLHTSDPKDRKFTS